MDYLETTTLVLFAQYVTVAMSVKLSSGESGSSVLADAQKLVLYCVSFIYTGSTKKMYTHFNERKLYVV